MTKMKWYLKVTDSKGRPCNGWRGKYSLPTSFAPGEWSPNRGPLLCQKGWHVTDFRNLNIWGQRDCRIFVVMGRGDKVGSMRMDGKAAFQSVRFLLEIYEWMIANAVRSAARGMSQATKNKLIDALLDSRGHNSYLIISEFPKVADELEKIIEKQLNRITHLL